MPLRLLRAALAVVLLAGAAGAQQPLRVATWNVQNLGSVGSNEWNRALDVLDRIGADVVTVQEVLDAEVFAYLTFQAQAGYAHRALAGSSGTLSGGFRNGVLSQHPIVFSQSHDAVSISGDPSANDITRDVLEVHVQVPGVPGVVGVFVIHLKSGSGSTNDFRRAVEIRRLCQVVQAFRTAHPGAPHVIAGDLNEDTADGPFGSVFAALPPGLPATYSLGSDVALPIVYDPFATLAGQGAVIADATQEDSATLYTTRQASGRRLDYLLHGGATALTGDEVYNSLRDNGFDDPPLGNWLPKVGAPLPAGHSLAASDHYAVFADLQVGQAAPQAPSLVPGDLVVSEYMNNPAAVPDASGEWLEIRNTRPDAVGLAGVTVRDHDLDGFVLPALTIPGRGFVVCARDGNTSVNGGVAADFVWPPGAFLLANGDDEIEIVSAGGTVLDTVVYDDGATFPDPDGRSVERIDATALPWAQNFGEATTPFGAGDLGSPGGLNGIGLERPFTAISASGAMTPGSTAFLTLDGGLALANRPYVLGAAECTGPGILLPASGRVVDLCPSELFDLSVAPGNPFFSGFTGALNVFGLASASVSIPAVPALVGFDLHVSGVVLDPLATEGVASVCDNLVITVN